MLALLPACGRWASLSRVLRLAEANRIAGMESDREALLHASAPLFREEDFFARRGKPGDWVPFVPARELYGTAAAASAPSFIGPGGKGGAIPPGGGCFTVVPVEPDRTVYVECPDGASVPGRFVGLVPLDRVPEPADLSAPGALRSWIRAHGQGIQPLVPAPDGKGLSLTVSTGKGRLPGRRVRACLVLAAADGKEPVPLPGVRAAYATAWHTFLLLRRARGFPHPVLAEAAEVEFTVRPSFFLPPTTSVTLKEMVVPGGAEFRCALGRLGGAGLPVSVTLEARLEGGTSRTVFAKTLDPGEEAWVPVARGLEDLAGKGVHFTFSARPAGRDFLPNERPPLVFVGSPALYHRELAKEETRPWNVVLISIDTLRADHLGSYGYGRPTSPRIDAIARRGVRFDRYYAHAPYTQPSHASLFTSLYPTVHGLNSVQAVIPPAADLLAEVLARNGYAAASWNNGGYVSHEFGFSRGFDLYCEVDPIGDRYLDGKPPSGRRLSDGSAGSLSRALAWVDAMKDRRFFLFLHTFMVHDYLPPRALAESFNRGCASRLRPGPAARALFTPERFAEGRRPPEDLRFFVNMYDASIRAADAMVGEVMDRLEAAGLLDRTVVVITADHGEEFMEHGSVGHLNTVYDEVLRVPLVLYWPGVPQGSMVPFTVNEVDLMPTVLDLLGIRAEAPLQGRSLLPLVTGAERGDRPVYAETRLPHRSERSCLVAGGWKYVRGDTAPSLKYPAPAPEQLFHLAGDPGERKDLFHAERVRARALAGRLDRFEKELRRLRAVITRVGASKGAVSAELRELLRQQGYL